MSRTIHLLPWYQRPLRCILGMHQWIFHPGMGAWVYCTDCHSEKRA